MEETEIIVEQPLAPPGRIHSSCTRGSCHSAPLSDEEQEDHIANEGGGWVTVDEDDLLATRLPARSGRGSSSSSSRQSTDDRHLSDAPSLTMSTSTTAGSLRTLSPTAAAAGRRNPSSDSGGRYGAVIHEGDEDGPLTPIDGEEEGLLKSRLPSPAGRGVMLSPTNSISRSKRLRLDSFGLDVTRAPATM